ncbi:MAG: c-type cytochrome [Rhodanobacter sp.]
MRIPMMVALLAAASLHAVARAAASTPPAQLGLCAACHGAHGVASMPGVPNLAGQRVDYLRAALRQYRDGRRAVPLMRSAIEPLSDAQLDALATWYSRQSPAQGQP